MKEKNNPQGKFNKYVIIFLALSFLISAMFNAHLFLSAERDIGASVEKIKNKYKYLDPAQGFYDQENLIVNIQPLREELTAIGEKKNISIYFEFLNTGANIAVNKDLTFWPASLMKIPVAMAVMKKVEDGEWKLENELVLFNDDKDSRFGELYKNPVGTRFTIERLLEEMLINSDNTARTIFMRNLESVEIDAVLEHLGIEGIFDENDKVSAKRYSIFWRALFTASYLSPEHSQKLLEILNKASATQYVKSGLPENVDFSHKIGVSDDIYSDSGIVYAPSRPYVLTVMMQEKDEEKAEELMKEISIKSYKYISEYAP